MRVAPNETLTTLPSPGVPSGALEVETTLPDRGSGAAAWRPRSTEANGTTTADMSQDPMEPTKGDAAGPTTRVGPAVDWLDAVTHVPAAALQAT